MASRTGGVPTSWFRQVLGAESLRYLAIYFAVQSAVVALFIAAFYFSWQLELPRRLVLWFLPLQCLLTLFAFRLAVTKQSIRTDHYLLLVLLSVSMLAWFLHDSGGHTNPLISLLLVPLAMSAALLRWQASAVVALTIVLAYAGLMNFYIPLIDEGSGHHHHGSGQMAQLHLFGMWITFCLSVLLILILVIPLAASIRKQREYIAQQREQALQDERLVAMATFAASAAHQLGTPLSTLSVIAEDLALDFEGNEHVQKDLQLMSDQVALCKKTLHDMMRRADAIRNNEEQILSLEVLLDSIKRQFNLLNPAHVLKLQSDVPKDAFIKANETLEQAILNLLDNASKASNDDPSIEIKVSDEKREVIFSIFNAGKSVSEEVVKNIGQPFISTRDKHEGMGLGLFLSNATISRMGGELKLYSVEGGSVTEIVLPLIDGVVSLSRAPA